MNFQVASVCFEIGTLQYVLLSKDYMISCLLKWLQSKRKPILNNKLFTYKQHMVKSYVIILFLKLSSTVSTSQIYNGLSPVIAERLLTYYL